MGLFDKKFCSLCGKPVGFLQNNKLQDGGSCCNDCRRLLSPLHTLCRKDTVNAVKYEIECRKKNIDRLAQFAPNLAFGDTAKIYIDEYRFQFAVAFSGDYRKEQVDIIDLSNITNCDTKVSESRKEIRYRDSNGEINSFSPPCYACAYDFYVMIEVNIPYISQMTIKLNHASVDNDQQDVVDLGQDSIFNKIADMFYKGKSYNGGKTTNADEVRNSLQYQTYETMLYEIKQALSKRPPVTEPLVYVKCPWCGSKVLKTMDSCKNCGGALEINNI